MCNKLETPPPGLVGPLPVRCATPALPPPTTTPLQPVSLVVNPGEHVAVVGANGSG